MEQDHTGNRREYFRVPIDHVTATMNIIEIGQRPITTESRTVRILNAGGGGIYIRAEEDLPIRRGVIAQFEFELGGFSFSLRGSVIRKLDDLDTFQYGVCFIDMDETQRGNLVSVLGRLQVEQKRLSNR